MQATKTYKGYTATVFFSSQESRGVFGKVRGWCYRLELDGKPLSAGGNLASQEAAWNEARRDVLFDIQQKQKGVR